MYDQGLSSWSSVQIEDITVLFPIPFASLFRTVLSAWFPFIRFIILCSLLPLASRLSHPRFTLLPGCTLLHHIYELFYVLYICSMPSNILAFCGGFISCTGRIP
eukprot:Rmarinus@m.10177